jgi:hypothetical protein
MEKRAPKDDILGVICEKIDLSFINELTRPYCSAAMLNIDVKPGNAEDSRFEDSFIQEPVADNNLRPEEAALGRGFDSYRTRRLSKEQKIKAAIPIKSGKRDKLNYYRKEAFQPKICIRKTLSSN